MASCLARSSLPDPAVLPAEPKSVWYFAQMRNTVDGTEAIRNYLSFWRECSDASNQEGSAKFPARAHPEFLALALAGAQKHSVAGGGLDVDLITELSRGSRIAEAAGRLRVLEPELFALVRARFNEAKLQADTLARFASVAERGGDAPLARRLTAEIARLSSENRLPADQFADPLRLDLARLEVLRRAEDPAWEPLFDALEERLESSPSQDHSCAAQALLRCGLPRAAYRHWARGGKQVDTKLVIALWQQDLKKESRAVVDHLVGHWLSALPNDWSSLGIVVALAIAQAQAGDDVGARASASVARRVAEESAASVLATGSGMPPEVAIWHLAKLLPLEIHVASDEVAALAWLARCEDLLATPRRARTPWEGRNSAKSTRVTTLSSLSEGCRKAGWYERAFDIGTRQKAAMDRWRDQLDAVRESGSPDLARRLLEGLADPRDHLDFALTVCRESTLAPTE
jgi:hypothetical protein